MFDAPVRKWSLELRKRRGLVVRELDKPIGNLTIRKKTVLRMAMRSMRSLKFPFKVRSRDQVNR